MRVGTWHTITIALSALSSCSQKDIITNTEPFTRFICHYSIADSTIESLKKLGVERGFNVDINKSDLNKGLFSILMWKEGFNIIFSGQSGSRDIFIAGIKRLKANEYDYKTVKYIVGKSVFGCVSVV